MPCQNIAAKLTDAELLTITTALTDIANVLKDKVVNLTPEERSKLYKMRNTRVSFAQRCMLYAQNNPALVPSFANYPEAQKDYNYYNQLLNLTQLTTGLAETLDDTLMATGSEVLQFCLIFYNNVKLAAQQNIPGSTSIYEDLNSFFDLPPRPEEDTETPTV